MSRDPLESDLARAEVQLLFEMLDNRTITIKRMAETLAVRSHYNVV